MKTEYSEEAAKRIAGKVHRTPVLSATRIGQQAGVSLFFKCENFQKTGSFKVRGVLNKLLSGNKGAYANGVVTISAGNHAQALAWGSALAGIPCTVVMPEGASPAKAEASRGYGAEVILHGSAMEAFEKAFSIAKERSMTFVHPFDDEEIIAGQGTVALELLEQLAEFSTLIVPVGGGGLIAGVSAVIKQLKPEIKIFGVEPVGACAMKKSFDAGSPQKLVKVNTVADGLGAPMAGKLNFELAIKYVDDMVVVTDDEIIHALKQIFFNAKLVAEPAAAAGVAGLLSGKVPVKQGDRVVCIISGGNVDAERLKEIL
jgi:threonine dehydratase